MSTARTGAAAAVLQDGSLLIAGGTDSASNVLSTVEIYGANGSFVTAPPMQTARTGHTAICLPNGTVLVAGGTTSGGGIINSAEIYDPAAMTWTMLPGMVDARTGHTATLLPTGDVLLAGGNNSSGTLASLEVFNMTTGAFSSAGAMSSPRKAHAAAGLEDGRVLIVGGTDQNGKTLGTTDIYDPNTGTVSAGPALITPRSAATATTLLHGRVLIAGGSYPEGAATIGGVAELASAEIFDPATDAITALASTLHYARAGHLAFLLPNNSNVLLDGGTFGGVALPYAELYTPWAKTFSLTASMAAARSQAVGGGLLSPFPAGLLLVAGGSNLASSELYGFATITTDKGDYAPGTPVDIGGSGWQPGETVDLYLHEVPVMEKPPEMTATADANGTISNSTYAPVNDDLGIRYYLTAVGASSQAQTTFTDSNYTVTVAVAGKGSGTISSTPAGVSCTDTAGVTSGACTLPTISSGTQVKLTVNTTDTITAWTVPTQYTKAGTDCNPGNTTCTFTINASSRTVTVTIDAVTTMTVTAASGTYGGSTTFSALLAAGGTGIASKSVSFALNGTNVGSATTGTSGSALGVATSSSVSLSGINAGTYSNAVTASFAGDTNYDSATGNGSLTIIPATPTVTVTCGTFTYDGNAHSCSAIATGVGSDGNISNQGSFSWNLTPSETTAGTYGFTANFTTTNPNYNNSGSGSGTLIINKATPAVAVTSTSSTPVFGDSLTFTATVTGFASGIPTADTVTFYDGGTVCPGTKQLFSQQLSGSGTVSFSTSALSAGEHSILACYSGDANYNSVGSTLTQIVAPATALMAVDPGALNIPTWTLTSPQGIVTDSSGDIYIAASTDIKSVDVSDTFSDSTISNAITGLSAPQALTEDSWDDVYIADPSAKKIKEWDGTNTYTLVSNIAAHGIVMDAFGNLYVSVFNGTQNVIEAVALSTDDNGNPVGTASVIAGGGTNLCLSPTDNCTATEVQLSSPQGLATDLYGNLYIADTGNNVVRKLTISTGIMTTVAGNGTAGYSKAEDGNSATDAKLNGPLALAVDPANNIYIVDSGNNAIRLVTSADGYIQTLAGTPPTAGTAGADMQSVDALQLNSPMGIALDNQGNVYITDTGSVSGKSRAIELNRNLVNYYFGNLSFGQTSSPATFTIRNIGTSTLNFASPWETQSSNPDEFVVGLVNGGSACPNLNGGENCAFTVTYSPKSADQVPDSPDSTTITPNSYAANNGSVVVTLTGRQSVPVLTVTCPSVTYDGSTHPCTPSATDSQSGNTINGSWTVTYNGSKTVPSAVGNYPVVGTFTSSDPGYLSGKAYSILCISSTIAAASKTTITYTPAFPVYGQTVTVTATVTSASGSGATPTGSVTFLVDWNSPQKIALNKSGVATLTLTGLSADTGNSYITDTHSVTVVYYETSTYASSSASATIDVTQATPTVYPNCYPAMADGNAHGCYPIATDAAGNFMSADTSGTSWTDPNGNQWVISYADNNNPGASSSNVPTPPAGQGDSYDVSITFTPADNVKYGSVVTDQWTNSPVLTISGSSPLMAVDPGTLNIPQWTAAQLVKLGLTSAVTPKSQGVAWDTAGDFYFTDTANNAVEEVYVTDTFSDSTITAYATGLNKPGALTWNPLDQNIYIADKNSGTVQMWTVANRAALTQIIGGLTSPQGIVADVDGNLYVADTGAGVVRMVDTNTLMSMIVAGVGTGGFACTGNQTSANCPTQVSLTSPVGLATDAAGNLYIADAGSNVIREVTYPGNFALSTIATVAGNGTKGYTGDTGLATSATLNDPTSIALDPANNLYIADTGNNALRMVYGSGSNIIINTITTWPPTETKGSGGADGLSATTLQLSSPTSVALDPLGNVYLADNGNSRTVEINRNVVDSDFGTVVIGQTTAATSLTISNIGSELLQVAPPLAPTPLIFIDPWWTDGNSASDSPNEFHINIPVPSTVCISGTSAALPPDANCTVAVAYAPNANNGPSAGTCETDTIYLNSNASNNSIPVTITASGTPVNNLPLTVACQDMKYSGTPQSCTPGGSATDPATGNPVSGTWTYVYTGIGSTLYGPSATPPTAIGTYAVAGTLPVGTACSLTNQASIGGTAYGTMNINSFAAGTTATTLVFNATTYTPATPGFPTYGGSATVNAVVTPAGANGTVTFNITNPDLTEQTQTAQLAGGLAVLQMYNLRVGTYTVAATYNGNATYATAANQTEVTVSPAFPTIYSNCYSAVFDPSQPNLQYGCYPTAYGANGNLISANTTGTSTSDGTWSITYGTTGATLPSAAGTYWPSITYTPSDQVNYQPNTLSAELIIANSAALMVVDPGTLDIPVTAWSTTSTGLSQVVSPQGLAADSTGDLFIADSANNDIIEANFNGVPFTDDNIIPVTAVVTGLNDPQGLALDSSGNLYITDAGDGKVLMWDNTTGDLPTVMLTGLSNPQGIVVDANSNVYVADTNNGVVRLINSSLDSYGNVLPGNGNTIIVAGTGSDAPACTGTQTSTNCPTSVTLQGPAGLAVDADGNLYIADAGNNVIREVTNPGNPALSTITTVAGNGTKAYYGDGGQATAAALSNPVNISIDPANNLYIVDSANNVIRMVYGSGPTPQIGCIKTWPGDGTASVCNGGAAGQTVTPLQLSSPTGITMDNYGNIYVADNGNNRTIQVNRNQPSLDLGTELIGQIGAPMAVSVSNIGSADMTLGNPWEALLAPADFFVNGSGGTPCSDSLLVARDTSCGMTAAFAPNAPVTVANESGNVAIYSNATDNHVVITLNGTPIPPVSCPGPLPYDGTPHSCIVYGGSGYCNSDSVTNVPGSTTLALSCIDTSGTTVWTGTGAITITPVTPSLSLACLEVGYDGTPQATCAGSATGVDGSTVAGTWTYSPASEINAGTYQVTGTFTSTDPNYNSGTATAPLIIDQANPLLTLACAKVIYNGNPQMPCVGSATVAGTWTYSPASETDAGSYPVTGTFTSTDPNYAGGTATAILIIDQATPVLNPACPQVPYNGSPQGCSPSATGVGGVVVTGTAACVYTGINDTTYGPSLLPPSAPGIYGGSCTFTSTDGNYTNASGAGVLVISQANTITTLSPAPGNSITVGTTLALTATVAPGTATGSVNFYNGTTLLATIPLSGGTASYTINVLAAGTYANLSVAYSGDPDYLASTSAPLIVTITPASPAPQPVLAVNPGTLSVYSSSLVNPQAVAVDGAGNVYVTDTGNNAVLKNSAPFLTGLNAPQALAADAAGNLYIAEATDIKRADGGGNLTSLAAGLLNPAGIAVDLNDNVYVADTGHNVILQMDPVTGATTVVAGLASGAVLCSRTSDAYGDGCPATQASLNGPAGLAFDATGNLFFADSADNLLRRVDAFSKQISSVTGINQPAGVAMDAAADLYFVDGSNQAVRMVNTTTGTITTIADQLNAPFGIALDGQGNVYAADAGNNRVIEVNRSQASLQYGAVYVNSSDAPQTVAITNVGAAAAQFATPWYSEDASGNFTISTASGTCSSGLTLAAGTSCNLAASFTPSTSGTLTDSLTIQSNAAPLTVTMTGTGKSLSTPTLTMACPEVPYNTTAQMPCTGTATGINGAPVSGTWSFSPASETNAGSNLITGTFTSNDPDYASNGQATATLTIDPISPTLIVTCPEVTYNATAQMPCTGTATGIGGVTVSGSFAFSPASATNAGSTTVTGTFTSTDTNYLNNGTATATLKIDPAGTTLSLTCTEVTYNSTPQMPCTGTASGINGVNVNGNWSFTPASETNAGSYLVTGTFTSSDSNYLGGTASATLIIDKAVPILGITCPESPYDGTPHGCALSATGIGGVPVIGTWSCTYGGSPTPPTTPGTYTVVCIFTSDDPNYTGGTVTGTITIAPAVPTPPPPPVCTFTYDGQPHSCIPSLPVGIGGVIVNGSWVCTPSSQTNAGTYAVACTFASTDPDYAAVTDSATLIILPATPILTLTCTPETFSGQPQPCTPGASAAGFNGYQVPGTWIYSYTDVNGTMYSIAPTGPGAFTVLGTFTSLDTNYTGGTVSAIELIYAANQAFPTIYSNCYPALYDGNPHGCNPVATDSNGNPMPGTWTFSYNLNVWPQVPATTTAPTAAGTYFVMITFTPTDQIYYQSNTVAAELIIVSPTPLMALDPGTLNIPAWPTSAQGLATDPYGDIYLADTANNTIDLVDINDTFSDSTLSVAVSGLNHPQALTSDPWGDLYIADTGSGTVQAWDGFDPLYEVAGGLNHPRGIVADSAGNLYVADTGNNEVDLVDINSGSTMVIAGGGTSCNSSAIGDGCPATQATLNGPVGLAADALGNLYIADTGNSVVRKITISSANPSASVITTIAGTPRAFGYSGDGGLATSAQLNAPLNIAVTPANEVYIVDSRNDAVRMVDVNGTIHTVAGTGTAGDGGADGQPVTILQLSSPTGIALDYYGNLYLADTSNRRAVEINRNLVTYDFGAGVMGKTSPATTFTIRNSGSASLTFGNPWESEDDPAVFVINGVNLCGTGAVLAVGATCQVTAAYSPNVIDSTPSLPDVDDISFSSNAANNQIDMTLTGVVPGPPILGLSCPAVRFNGQPHGCTGSAIAVDGITPVSGSWTYTYGGTNGTAYGPTSTPPTAVGTYSVVGTFTSANVDYTGGTATGTLIIYDWPLGTTPTTTTVTASWSLDNPAATPQYPVYGETVTVSATVAPPSGSSVPPTGTVTFVIDSNAPQVVSLVDTQGVLTGVASLPVNNLSTDTGNLLPTDTHTITATYNGDPNYNVSSNNVVVDVQPTYPTIYSNCYPVMYDGNPHGCYPIMNGVQGTPIPGPCTISYNGYGNDFTPPTAAGEYWVVITCTPNDNIDYQSNSIWAQLVIASPAALMVVTPGTLNIPQWGAQPNPVNPQGMTSDNWGDIYLADTANSAIEAVNVYDTFSDSSLSTMISTGLNHPQALTWNPNDTNIYIADTGSGTVQAWDGGPTPYAVADGLNAPRGIVADADGNLYVSDTGNNEIDLVDPNTGNTMVVAGGGTSCATATDALGDGCPATHATLKGPVGLATDAYGNLYIADAGNNRVRKVTIDPANLAASVITTIAGGATMVCSTHTDTFGDGCPATQAILKNPLNLGVDPANEVYIVDAGNNIVRLVTSSGTIQAWAGSGTKGQGGADGESATSLQLSSPTGFVLDIYGNGYIADTGNERTIEVNRNVVIHNFPPADNIGQTSAPTTFSVANIGSATLTFDNGISPEPNWYTEDDPGEFLIVGTPPCTNGGVLTVDAICQWTAAYSPNANYGYLGWTDVDDVYLNSNASNNPVTVTLTGTPTDVKPTVSCTTVTYNGSPHTCSGSDSVSGSWSYTYNGNPTPPIAAGTYDVVATFTPTNQTLYPVGSVNAYGQLEITPRSVTASVTAQSKVYNGNTIEPIGNTTCSLSGVEAVDAGNVTCAGATATFASASVSSSKITVTVAGIVLDGSAAANYVLSATTATTSAYITKPTLTPYVTALNKTYDRTTTEPIADIPCSLVPTVASVTCTVSAATFAQDKVGTWTVTATVSLSGTAAGDYALSTTHPTSTASITPRPITVTAKTNSKTYDGTTSAAAVPTITSGSLPTGDTATWTETYGDKNVGTGKTLTPAGTVSDGNGGNNYTITFVTITGTIASRAITVTAATNTKVYDGTTSAAALPTITSTTKLATGDTAVWSESYTTPTAGSSKTLVPAGTVNDGNNGGNYTITFANSTTGVINKVPLTVTGVTANNKVYDGTTSATLNTSGAVLVGVLPVDTALVTMSTSSATGTFASKNVGTGITVTVAGITISGASAANYSVTQPTTTANITVRAITVTAKTNSKTYDGTTSASTAPTITTGSLGTGDTVTWTETYDTKNVGAGKTLTPGGTVSDGNGGNNYSVTFVPVNTGTITTRAITVTAATNTKVYDGATSAAALPTITSTTKLATGDSATWSETYNTKNVGTAKTLTPSGTVSDGNNGGNYTVTFVNNTTGVITTLPITVTAAPNTKTADGTTSAAAIPTITSGSLATGDTATWWETYTTPNPGTGLTLVPAGTVSDGNSGNNYAITFVDNYNGVILAD